MRNALKPLLVALLCISVQAHASDADCDRYFAPKSPLINFDRKTYEFKGLTPEGLAILKQSRDILLERDQLFRNEIRNLDSIHHAGTVARLQEGHMFIYGPPGGAKSMFVEWMMKGEREAPFKLQLHQMVTEQAFVGGQDFEAAKKGKFEINVKGSMADYQVALLDEIEKGNPAALASILGLLNERQVMVGGQVVKAKLETLFATSNANLPEFLQMFVENGQGSTAPALLNRFQFKGFVYNWLPVEDQAELDKRRSRARYLKALAKADSSVSKDEVFLEPKALNWDALRQIARAMFDLTPEFMSAYREMMAEMRKRTNEEIRASEARRQTSAQDEPFVYFPSADYTERLRLAVPEIIIMSAFVDFMTSDLADVKKLEANTRTRIHLDPLSLWRSYLVLTTIGPGKTQFTFKPDADQKVNIDFGWNMDSSLARDKREELMIRNLRNEQERLKSAFDARIKSLQGAYETSAKHTPPGHRAKTLEEGSFELRLLKAR